MKRLLLITLDYPPKRGGVARYLHELTEYFGKEISVITDGLLFKNIWPHWLKALIKTVWRRTSYDVLLISHVLPLGVVARWNKKLTGKPYVVMMHGMDFALARRNKWKQKLTRQVLQDAEVVVVNSENLAREVLGFVRPKKIEVIYPCLSKEILESAQAFKRDQTIGKQEKQKPVELLTVARLVPRKGHAVVLDALALLKSSHRIGTFRYTIVGDGPMFPNLEAHTKELGLIDEVVFVQHADDAELIKTYKQSDVFLMPTEHQGKDIEGFGTVYMEAAAFGLPSIASQLPGVDEAVLDRQTGLLIPSSSVADLAEAIERLAADPMLRFKLGSNGRERALKDFIADVQFAKLRQIL